MSAVEVGDSLVLTGLALQGGAVFVILARAGAISEAWATTRRTAGAAREMASRLLAKLPWREEATTLVLEGNSTSLVLSPSHGEARPFLELETPPGSLEEVRKELNVLRLRLNRHDDRITKLSKKSRREVEEARTEAQELVDAAEVSRKEETRQAIRERRWEGLTLLVGFVLQIAGVVVAFGG